jgi:radical SAM protein with 4Fe4S-binding SPASM domain
MSRPPSPECALLSDLHDRAYRGCIPLQASLELTLRCNLRCVHCYNFDRAAGAPPPGPELTFDEILSLMDELRSSGTLFLSLTGGEPMAHPRFWDLMDEAAARRFAVNLLTNGTLLDAEACDRLARGRNLWQVSLSFYGARPETHDAVTRGDGSFRRSTEALRLLKRRSIPATIKLVILKEAVAEAGDMIAMAREAGLPFFADTSITARIDGTRGSLDHRVDPGELEALYRGPLRPLLGPTGDAPGDDGFTCNCARGNVAVSATGEVWPCIAAPWSAGNLRERGFREIWEDSPVFRRIRGLRAADFGSCAPCALKAWCPRGPGGPFLLHGDYTGIDPWTCREAGILRDILG